MARMENSSETDLLLLSSLVPQNPDRFWSELLNRTPARFGLALKYTLVCKDLCKIESSLIIPTRKQGTAIANSMGQWYTLPPLFIRAGRDSFAPE